MADDHPDGHLPIEERLRLAAIFADRARVMFEMWRFAESGEGGISGEGSRLRDVPDFVRWNKHAHLTSCIAYVGILYDGDPRSISLPRLAGELADRDEPHLQHLAEAGRLLRDARPTCERVKVLRNKLVAHRDRDLSSADAFARAKLKVGDLAAMLDTSCTIADRLLQAMGLPAVSRSVEPLKQMRTAYETIRAAR